MCVYETCPNMVSNILLSGKISINFRLLDLVKLYKVSRTLP